MSGKDRPDKNRPQREYHCADGSWRPSRPEGLARVIAKAGYGARPRVEAVVRAGRVTVDGVVELDPGRAVDRPHEVRLDGVVLREAPRRYLLLHKPAGVDCQERRHAGRWIGDYLPEDATGLEPVGRLDLRSRGLLLVSNDLAWNDAVSRDHKLERRYEVAVSGTVSSPVLDVLRAGMSVAGQGPFRPMQVEVLVAADDRTRIGLLVRGGHQRLVRTVFTNLRHEVLSIVRTGLGPVTLADLPSGGSRDLKQAEIQRLATPCRKS